MSVCEDELLRRNERARCVVLPSVVLDGGRAYINGVGLPIDCLGSRVMVGGPILASFPFFTRVAVDEDSELFGRGVFMAVPGVSTLLSVLFKPVSSRGVVPNAIVLDGAGVAPPVPLTPCFLFN